MRGEESREDILFRPDEWYGEQHIELLTRTSVTALDVERARGEALQQGGDRASRRRCSRRASNVRHPARRRRQLDGIHYLRTIGNSDAIREERRGASASR